MRSGGQLRRTVSVVIRVATVLALVVTSWASIVQPATAQSTATLNLTLRGCPEGIVPQSVNPAVTCDIPLDAPGSAGIHWGQGQASLLIVDQGRLWDGTYSISVPANVPLTLYNLEPAVRDDFMAVGADTATQGGDPVITLAPGQTRSVGIYYYYYAQGSGQNSGSIEPVGTDSATTEAPAPATSSAPDPAPATGTIYVISSIAGWPFLNGCYELVDFSEPVCSIMIRDMTYAAIFQNVPAGTYTVRQTNDIGDNYVPDFTIDVTGGEEEFFAEVIMPWGSPSKNGGTKQFFDIESIDYDQSTWPRDTDNVSVVFIDTDTREKVASDACVQIIDASNVGCDTHRGQIDFLDIPGGPHDVIVTNVPDGYVLGPGMENLQLENSGGTPNGPFHVVYFIDLEPVSGSGDAPPAETSETTTTSASTTSTGSTTVKIATSNILGYPVHNVCYELIGYAENTCSDREYAVFENVPPGTYTAHQTLDLGETYVPDFTFEVREGEDTLITGEIMVSPWGSPSRLGSMSYGETIDYDHSTWQRDTDNVSFIFIDTGTGEKIVSDACVQIIGASNVGCDTHRGQIDFIDIPAGPHQIIVTHVPNGYELAPGMETLEMTNPGGSPNGPIHVMYFIDLAPISGGNESSEAPVADATASDTAASGSSTVGIHTTIAGWPYSRACYELVGFSDSTCSILVADMAYHAIFKDVPHGTYTVRQTEGFGESDVVYVPDFTIEVTEDEQVFDAAGVIPYGSPSRSGVASPSDLGIEFVPDFQEPDSFAVYVVFIDVESREKVTSDACAQILGASNVGCDTQRGQIDFTYVPTGNYEVMITRPPTGYELAPGMEHLPIVIPGRGSAADPYHLVYFIDVVPTGGS